MQTRLDITKLSDFFHPGAAIGVASCGNLQKPALTTGLGCTLLADKGYLCLFVSRITAADLLNDIIKHPNIAVVFCLPATEQAIQIKGKVITVRLLTDTEFAHLAIHREAFAEKIYPLGYSRAFVDGYLYAEDPIALEIEAEAVYQQTPGPLAGSLLAL